MSCPGGCSEVLWIGPNSTRLVCSKCREEPVIPTASQLEEADTQEEDWAPFDPPSDWDEYARRIRENL